jgi:DNA-binding MarR family transcriptional regulator
MRTKIPENLYLRAPRLNQYCILSEVAAVPHITQAELARRCDLSVAMVNNYMKELCAAGLLEYRRKSSKSMTYHLTPSGKEQVAAIEHELLCELATLFGQAKERVRNLIASQVHEKLQRVVLHGTGTLAELAFHALESAAVDIVGVCDDNPSVVGREWCGREVLNANQVRFIAPDAVIIASPGRTDEVYSSLKGLIQRGIRLICLDGNGSHAAPLENTLPLSAVPSQAGGI